MRNKEFSLQEKLASYTIIAYPAIIILALFIDLLPESFGALIEVISITLIFLGPFLTVYFLYKLIKTQQQIFLTTSALIISIIPFIGMAIIGAGMANG